jgi:hypothetical protein
LPKTIDSFLIEVDDELARVVTIYPKAPSNRLVPLESNSRRPSPNESVKCVTLLSALAKPFGGELTGSRSNLISGDFTELGRAWAMLGNARTSIIDAAAKRTLGLRRLMASP